MSQIEETAGATAACGASGFALARERGYNAPRAARFSFGLRTMLAFLRQPRLSIVALAFALGCVRSERPLVDEQASIVDADLIGEWCFEDDEANPFRIEKKPGSETVLRVFAGEDDQLELLLSKIGDDRYLSVECLEPPGYMIFRYELRGGAQVVIYELDAEVIHAAIAEKQLAGKAWRFFGPQAQITGSSAEIRSYLAKHGKDCFERHASLVVNRLNKAGN